MEKREEGFRNKITWFTFLFSILVVWVHSYNAELFLGNGSEGQWVEKLEGFLGDTLAQVAVPGFFMISAYLFFRGFTWGQLKRKWNSRIRSVLVPYIVWNTLYFAGYAVGSRIPFLGGIIGKGIIPVSLPALIDAILHYTYNYVFWYLYQLILLILLAPLIYLAVRRAVWGLAALAVIYGAVCMGISLPVLNLDALFYYAFGALAAVRGKDLVEGKWSWGRGWTGAGIIALGILILSLGLPGEARGEAAGSAVAFRLLCPAGLWFLWPDKGIPQPRTWMKNNFFFYAVHFALVRLVNKTGAWLLPPVPVIPIVFYLLMPFWVAAVSQGLGSFLRGRFPMVWRLLNGGR